jgi:hypothetical protein
MAFPPKHRLRLVGEDEPSPSPVASYRNRNGATYYLHEGLTKTGKPRYFVRKTVEDGARAALPDGFEFHESLNGVVSVRRTRGPSPIPAADFDLVRAELARHPHLADYVAEIHDASILIFEPQDSGFSRMAGIMPAELQGFARELGLELTAAARRIRRYEPVMRFDLSTKPQGLYALQRMTYRGDGGWMLVDLGPLKTLVDRLAVLGTDAFFELY